MMIARATHRRRGMSALQTVLLLGVAFVVVWGLIEIWRQLKPPIQAHVQRILGVEAASSPGSSDTVGGGTGGSNDTGNSSPNEPEPWSDVPKPMKGKTDREDGWTPDWIVGDTQSVTDSLWGIGKALWPGGVSAEAVWTSAVGEVMSEAVEFAKRNGKPGGERNALQHSYWQAQLAFHYGPAVAEEIGNKHENWQGWGNAGRQRDTEADLLNNEIGRHIGAFVRKEAAGPAGKVPGYDPNKRMKELLLEALNRDVLDAKRELQDVKK